MKVSCPGCNAEFAVDDNRIPPQGLKVRCPQCFKSIEVGGDAAPSSDLEASLGVDLSGPSEAPESVIPHDGWGDEELATPPPDPSGKSAQGEDWDDLDPLSADDLSLIGTYEKVVGGGQVLDDVWGATGEFAQQGDDYEDQPMDADGPATLANQESPLAPLEDDLPSFDEEMTAPEMQEPQAPEPPPEELFRFEGTLGNPDDPSLVEPTATPDPEPKPAPPAIDDFGQEDLFDFGGEEPETPAAPLDSADAPDSIFAIEERSGLFSSQEIGLDQEAPADGPGLDADDWDFGDLPEQGEPGGTQLGMPDPSVAFHRDSLTQEHDAEELQRQAAAIPPSAPPEQPITSGGPTLDDIDFASLLDEVPGDKASDSQVFFVDSPSGAEGDFEKPSGDNSFSMEELSFDELDSLDAPSEEFATSGSQGQSGIAEDDLFDLDMDPSEVERAMPSLDTALPTPQVKSTEPTGRPRPVRRKRRSGLGILVVLLLLGGAGFGAYQMGFLDEFIGKKQQPPLKLPTRAKKNEAEGPRLLATPVAFDKRLQTLDKQIELRPREKVEIQEEMLWVLAWYRFLFPDTFQLAKDAQGKPLEDQFVRLQKSYAGQVFKLKLEAMALGTQGEWTKGAEKYQEYLDLKARKMAELLEKSKITAQVAQEDNLLNAWFAVRSGRLEKAEALLKDLVGEKSGELYPSLLEVQIHAARAQAAQKAKDETLANAERSRASDRLEALLEKYPDHVQSKLLLSELYSGQGKYDQAIELATRCLATGKEQKNFALQIDSYRALARYLQATDKKDELFKLLEQMKLEILGKKTGLPEPEDLLLLLCELYLERNLVGQALGALELCGEACTSPNYYLLHARSYEMSKLLHTAIERAKAGHDKYPTNADLLMLLARLAKETGQTNSSVAYLEKILALRPDNLPAALTLANLFLELQDPPNARKVLMEAERYVEDSLQLQEMLAQINEAMGDDPGTISALTKILELKGEAPEIRKKLASYLVKQGNYQDALTHYELLEKQGRITPELRQDFAKCLRATGRTQDALDVLKELLRDNPGDVETARFLADIYLQKEDFFNAKFYLEATRRADTTNPEVHYLIGTTCLKLDDDNCALEAFQKAVELDPEKLEYVEKLANLLFKRSRSAQGERKQQFLKQARKYFLYIITRYETKDLPVPEDRRNADVYFNHGQILFETGHYEKALKDLDKAMFLAKHRFDMLVTYADTLYKMNRYKEAVKYYQEMLDSDVDKPHAYFFLGKIHLIQGKREQAKTYFLQCIAITPDGYPDAHKHLGDIFREKRLRKKAIDHYRTFLKLTPPNDPAAEEVKAALRKL